MVTVRTSKLQQIVRMQARFQNVLQQPFSHAFFEKRVSFDVLR
jgi:hypothetical protein